MEKLAVLAGIELFPVIVEKFDTRKYCVG